MIGAGAAGLMTALAALDAKDGPRASVVLFDSRPKIGAKILISGGTRCNVTNRKVTAEDYHGGPRHFIRHVFEAFTPSETIRFFEGIGVELVLEPTGKYFPATHSGKTVLEALIRECEKRGAQFMTGVKIVDVQSTARSRSAAPGHRFALLTGTGQTVHSQAVVLCTGGLSLPQTGSDGTGLGIAEKLGHAVLRTAPALTPLLSDDKDWAGLSGLTLEDVRLDFYERGKKKASSRGGFLFTHFGFSGPAALDISRHVALAKKENNPQIVANFSPADDGAAGSRGHAPWLPKRFFETLRKKCAADLSKRISRYPLEVTGVYGYKKAEVTAGGVDLKEVNVATMESKKLKGLYFAGEILDVDGRIGGFNFQWSWSTGSLAGKAAAKSLQKGAG